MFLPAPGFTPSFSSPLSVSLTSGIPSLFLSPLSDGRNRRPTDAFFLSVKEDFLRNGLMIRSSGDLLWDASRPFCCSAETQTLPANELLFNDYRQDAVQILTILFSFLFAIKFFLYIKYTSVFTVNVFFFCFFFVCFYSKLFQWPSDWRENFKR